MNTLILTLLTTAPSPLTATEIATKLDASPSTTRKWLKRLRDAGSVLAAKVSNVLRYSLKQVVKATKAEVLAKVTARAERHLARALEGGPRASFWRKRHRRASRRALALAG